MDAIRAQSHFLPSPLALFAHRVLSYLARSIALATLIFVAMNFRLLSLCLAALLLCPIMHAQNEPQTPAPPKAQETTQATTPDTPATATADTLVAVPNRPTFATTAETVQRGVFEIEYGLEAASGHQNINGLLKFGALKNLELRFANDPIERVS